MTEDVHPLQVPWRNEYTVFRPEGHEVWRRWRGHVDRYMFSGSPIRVDLVSDMVHKRTYYLNSPEDMVTHM